MSSGFEPAGDGKGDATLFMQPHRCHDGGKRGRDSFSGKGDATLFMQPHRCHDE
jgi:hypothetical protein